MSRASELADKLDRDGYAVFTEDMRDAATELRRLERVNAELLEALNSTNKALEAIGDYAHDRSTGPAVWDALWEIRSMAYDNVCTVDAALTSATKEQQK